MELRIFTLRFDAVRGRFDSAELDAYCASKRIIESKSAFFQSGDSPWWTIYICCEPLLPDEKPVKGEVLPDLAEGEQALLQKLKLWRKEIAEAKGFPAYLIATNSQLAYIITHRIITLSGLEAVRGFGKKRISDYGKELIDQIKQFFGHESAQG